MYEYKIYEMLTFWNKLQEKMEYGTFSPYSNFLRCTCIIISFRAAFKSSQFIGIHKEQYIFRFLISYQYAFW